MNRDNTIDILKFIAIFMVICGHTFQYFGIGVEYLNIPFFKITTMIQMPLFTFISGYVSYKAITQYPIKQIFSSRARSLLWPMCVFSTLMFVITLPLIWQHADFQLIIPKYVGSIIYSYWYIWVILYSICSAYLSNILLGYKGLLISLLIVILVPFNIPIPHILYYKAMYPFFVGGLIFYKYDLFDFIVSYKKVFIALLSLIFIGCYYWYDYNNVFYFFKQLPLNQCISSYLHMLISGFCGICLIYILVKFLGGGKHKYTKIMMYLGQYTFGLYMLQGIVFKIVENNNLFITNYLLLSLIAIGGFASMCLCIYLISHSEFLSKHLLGKFNTI